MFFMIFNSNCVAEFKIVMAAGIFFLLFNFRCLTPSVYLSVAYSFLPKPLLEHDRCPILFYLFVLVWELSFISKNANEHPTYSPIQLPLL